MASDPKELVKPLMKPLGLADHFKQINFQDIMHFSGFTLGGCLFGWFNGKPVRAQTAATAGVIGSTAGFLYVYKNIHYRILGDLREQLDRALK